MLIDESERTFKRGIIVTATVVKVQDDMVLCKLDNALDAIIFKTELLGDTNERLQNAIQVGHVITGRINDIRVQHENRFAVTLDCKKSHLEDHGEYIADKSKIHPDDLKNYNFQIEKK